MLRASDRRERLTGFVGRVVTRRARLLVVLVLVGAALLAVAPADRSEAIINGGATSAEPWVAAVAGSGAVCSGALVAPTLVLSAEHCRPVADGGVAAIGKSDLNNSGQGTLTRITGVVAHPSADVALYVLDRAVDAWTIDLSSIDPMTGGKNVPLTLYGYGRNSDLTEPIRNDEKLHSAVGLVGSCVRASAAPRFCLKPQSIQFPCEGDSGGPLVASGRLVGVLSSVQGLGDTPRCTGATWVATSVTDPAITSWINQTIDEYE